MNVLRCKTPISIAVSVALLVQPFPVIGLPNSPGSGDVAPNTQEISATRPRVALVIGNSKYQHVAPLITSINDAADISASLEKLGFQVTKAFEADTTTLKKAIADFAAMLKTERYRNALAVFYYAGHGTQSSGRNFLLPIDLRIEKNNKSFDNAVDINEDVVQQFSRVARGVRPGPNIIILDACRDDPLGGRPGLSRIEVPTGTLLAFAAAAGQQAIDTLDRNKPERNGLYARFLLQELNSRNRVDMEKFFKILKRKVNEASMQRQDPLIMPNLIEDVYFELESSKGKATAEENFEWKAIEKSTEACDFESFLAKYPSGEFAESARATLDEIKKKDEATRKAYADLPDSVRDQAIKSFKDKGAESDAWCKVKQSDNVPELYSFLEKFPAGRNTGRARARIATIESQKGKQEESRRQAQALEAEKSAWAKAEQSGSLGEVSGFLQKYPASEHRIAAEKKIAELQQKQRLEEARRREEEAWAKVSGSKDIAVLQGFAAQYPGSPFAAQAKARIDDINAAARADEERVIKARLQRELDEWNKVKLAKSQPHVEIFLSRFPESAHVGEARALLNALREEEAGRVREAAAAQARAQAEAQARAQAEAQARAQAEALARAQAEAQAQAQARAQAQTQAQIEAQARAQAQAEALAKAKAQAEEQARLQAQEQAMRLRAEDLQWNEAEALKRRASYETYIERYPQGRYVAEAQKRIAALEAAQSEEKRRSEQRQQALARETTVWEKIQASSNPGDFDDYLRAYPEGAHAADARKRIAVLAEMRSQRQARETEEWNQIQSGEDTAALESFVGKYPSSQYAAVARDRIEALKNKQRQETARRQQEEEERSWQQASQAQTADAFRGHLDKYPSGRYAAQARVQIGRLAETKLAAAPAGPVNPEFQNKLNKAEQGDSDAMYHLALLYQKGAEGVKADTGEMLKWLLLSSTLGNGLASYKLYTLYAADPTGYSKSIKYKNLSLKQGYCGPPTIGNARGKQSANACSDT